jgi:phosphatidylinositol alpha-1,6-mannosyltransferase
VSAARTWIVLTSDFPPAIGGIQRYCASLAEALAASGHAVHVVAPEADGDAGFDTAAPYRVTRVRGRGFALVPALASGLRRALDRADGPVHVIVSGWKPAGIAAALARTRGAFSTTYVTFGSEIAHQQSPLRRFLVRRTLAAADRVVAISSFTAGIVHEVTGYEADVIPVGVRPLAVPSAAAADPTIVSVGRLVARKGFDRLIQAFALAQASLPNAFLEIVGDGPQRAQLEALAESLGVAERTRFLGAVSDAELEAAYARAWCFAMPNRREGDDVEGFGIVFLEAALAGLPAIGGRSSGAEDAIEDGVTGMLVDGNDVWAIAAALERLLGDRAASFAMGTAARARAIEHFSWANVARMFETV